MQVSFRSKDPAPDPGQIQVAHREVGVSPGEPSQRERDNLEPPTRLFYLENNILSSFDDRHKVFQVVTGLIIHLAPAAKSFQLRCQKGGRGNDADAWPSRQCKKKSMTKGWLVPDVCESQDSLLKVSSPVSERHEATGRSVPDPQRNGPAVVIARKRCIRQT